MSEPESLEEQAAQEGYDPPEYEPDEEPAEDFPDWDADLEPGDYDTSDPYDIEYDVP